MEESSSSQAKNESGPFLLLFCVSCLLMQSEPAVLESVLGIYIVFRCYLTSTEREMLLTY